MPLRTLFTALAAAGSFAGAFAYVHAGVVSPASGLIASAVTTVSHATDRASVKAVTATPAPTAVPTPAPTPLPTPVPVVQRAASAPVRVPAPVVVQRAPAPPPAPVVLRNQLTSGDGTLHTAVGVYSDCSGRSELTHAMAAIDTCIPGPQYFVGHNAGVFTPLMHMGVGSIITYYDGGATAHVWRVVSVRGDWRSANGVPPATEGDVVAQFQTCVVPDGSIDRILDVVPA
ncbi:MAG TPA: hypothetical protein VGL20_00980 [Candidatus Dormibacteraeota bacterium]|jgi:hypothetical protein